MGSLTNETMTREVRLGRRPPGPSFGSDWRNTASVISRTPTHGSLLWPGSTLISRTIESPRTHSQIGGTMKRHRRFLLLAALAVVLMLGSSEARAYTPNV